MKKVIVLSLGVMFLAVLGSSCKKKCTCKTYTNDEVTATTTTETKGKCTELNTVVTIDGKKSGVECE